MPLTAATAPRAVLYVSLVPLDPECRPALLERAHGRTLLWVDPSATRAEAMAFCLREMKPAEIDYLCSVYGEPERFLTDQRPVIQDVPPVLQVPRSVAQVLTA